MLLSDTWLWNIMGHKFCKWSRPVQEQVWVLQEGTGAWSGGWLPRRGWPWCCWYTCYLQCVSQIPGATQERLSVQRHNFQEYRRLLAQRQGGHFWDSDYYSNYYSTNQVRKTKKSMWGGNKS